MKKIQLVLLILVLLSSGGMAQSSVKSSSLKPTNFQKKVTTVISGKSRSYYSLSAESPSVINLEGPGKLIVHTRGRFAAADAGKLGYEIIYTVDGGEQKSTVITGVDRATDATYLNGTLGVPGQLKSFQIDLGRGHHTIEFKLKDSKTHVAARYILTPIKEKKQEWNAYSPKLPSEPVDLISGETSTTYYRFAKDKPLKVEVIGPTELRIFTRAENHYDMKGRIHYRVQVKEADKVINTYQLSSVRSETASYKDKANNKLIPGKACEFVIMVPKGTHTYTILPMDEDKSTILGRMLIPKKDVKLKK
jgi:hypothetical protein